MSRFTLSLYLSAPLAMVAWSVSSLFRNSESSLADLVFGPVQMFIFYCGPHLLWLGFCKLKGLSSRYWHAGLVGATLALGTCLVLSFVVHDQSGLPYQWFLYWPLAAALQILFALLCWIAFRRRLVPAPNKSLERTREG